MVDSLVQIKKRESASPENLENLIDFRISGEKRASLHDHLGENAADGPHVDSSRIMTRP